MLRVEAATEPNEEVRSMERHKDMEEARDLV